MITKEKWEQTGSLIVAFGENGAVICKMAEPYPTSGLAEFLPLKMNSVGWDLQIANANLIVSAVNACIKLNPENPQAVAESIGEMYEALKNIVQRHEKGLALGEQMDLMPAREVLAKANGK